MNSKLFLISLVMALFFLGCAGPLTESNNNSTIEYALDSPFEVELTAPHDSQNRWHLISDNAPAIIFENVVVTTAGAEDTYSFNFLVKGASEEHIVIAYGTDDEQLKRYEVTVICGTMGRILSD